MSNKHIMKYTTKLNGSCNLAGTRKAYDKLLKGRKAAKLRAREADAKTQKLRSELEERERRAQEQPTLSEEER